MMDYDRMQRCLQPLLFCLLVTLGFSEVVQACDLCCGWREAYPRYNPGCQAGYGFHATQWRSWNGCAECNDFVPQPHGGYEAYPPAPTYWPTQPAMGYPQLLQELRYPAEYRPARTQTPQPQMAPPAPKLPSQSMVPPQQRQWATPGHARQRSATDEAAKAVRPVKFEATETQTPQASGFPRKVQPPAEQTADQPSPQRKPGLLPQYRVVNPAQHQRPPKSNPAAPRVPYRSYR